MTRRLLMIAGCLIAGLCSPAAFAAYNCSSSSANGFNTAYDPTRATDTLVQSSFTLSCIRATGTGGDPAAMAYSITASNGVNNQGAKNNAALGSDKLSYDLYQDSACATAWNPVTPMTGTLTFSGTSASASVTRSYWACLPAKQKNLSAGVHTDIVTVTITTPDPAPVTRTISVNIDTPFQCALNTPVPDLSFSYTSFSAADVVTPTTFTSTCTNYMPYTISVTPATGTLLPVNLSYTLSLPVSSTSGTGAAQTFTVNGTMPAGQSGTCSTATCTATPNVHTITLSY